MTNEQYTKYVSLRSNRSKCFLNCLRAFLVGGIICLIGELFLTLYKQWFSEEEAFIYVSVTLIFLAGLITGIGVFDKIAKYGGGGALVPITGFSNSVTAPAIEAKSEGFITGVASKMFTIAGPVIVYGVSASIIYGIIYYFIR